MPRVAQRDRRGASDEVVCVLAGAFGFESADDYGRANEATLSRLRAQARRARALAKVNAFVSRHGLAFSPPSSPPISPPTISEQQVQVDYGRANEATLSRLRAQAYRLDNGLAAMKAPLKDKRSALAALDSEIDELERTLAAGRDELAQDDGGAAAEASSRRARALAKVNAFVSRHGLAFSPPISPPTISEQQVLNPFWLRRRRRLLQRAFWLGSCALKDAAASKRNGDGAFFLNGR